MAVFLNDNEIVLSGTVGDMFMEDGFTASDVITALAAVGRDREVTIRLNSGGGIATEGAAIHSALAQHRGGVNIIVEGVAASAASLIAMAGDTIQMRPGSVMMIHDPAGFTMGDAAAHAKTIDALNALGDAYAGVYADKTGKSVEDMRELMRAETWMTAAQAVEAGFADAIAASNDNDEDEDDLEPAAFAYAMYAKAPSKLVALANARGWKARAMMAAPAAPPRHKETTMTEEAQAGETPAVVEPEVEAVADAKPETIEAMTPEACAQIVEICASAGVPAMSAALIREGVSIEQAKARADNAKDIRAAVALASKSYPAIEAAMADEFIAKGYSVEKARSALFEKIVASQSPEVSPHIPVNTKTASASWDKIAERINARNSAA